MTFYNKNTSIFNSEEKRRKRELIFKTNITIYVFSQGLQGGYTSYHATADGIEGHYNITQQGVPLPP